MVRHEKSDSFMHYHDIPKSIGLKILIYTNKHTDATMIELSPRRSNKNQIVLTCYTPIMMMNVVVCSKVIIIMIIIII